MLTPSATPPLVKIAIYRSSSIGDVILATACIELLRQLPVQVQITWVGRRPAIELIASAYPNIKILEIDPSIRNYQEKIIQELQGSHFLIDLQTNLRSQLLCRALKREFKIPSYSCQKRGVDRGTMIIKARIRGRRRSLPENMTQDNHQQYKMMTRVLKQALITHLPIELLDGIDRIEAFPCLPTSHDDGQKPWQKELRFGRWLAIAPGAAHESKKAPLTLLRNTVELLKQTKLMDLELGEQKLGLLFVGNEKDRESALSILDTLDWPGPLLNLAGKLSLWETALALKEVDGLLCNDSGLLHLCEAVGVPVAAWFGPTVEAFGFTPWRLESKAFSALLGCRPCSKHGQLDCRYADKLCFGLIQPVHVVEHLKTFFKRNLKSKSV